jgi:tetratricopeptide (TPR) repeat protein
MLSRSSTSDTPLVIHLSSISAYSTFGELLRTIRNHHNTSFHSDLSPQKITEVVNLLLTAKGGKKLGKRAYADLESGRRYPRFIELEPIFRALVEKCYVEFTDLEITAYVHLAKEKIVQNQKPKEKVREADWDILLENLFRIHQSKPGRVHLLTDAQTQSEPSALTEDTQSRRLQAIKKAQDTDVRHLLEREEWVTNMLKYPKMDPPVKLVVVQGAIGVGKSSALALLAQRTTAQSPDLYMIPYLFLPGEDKTPEDHLDEFLATIMTDLTLRPDVSGENKQHSLTDRIRQVLTAIKSRKEKVIFLLDDAHYIFPVAGEWSPSWLEFMETLVRESHNATFYLFTRTWPGWDERRLAYIEPTELLDLSPTASVSLWQHRGFDDVPETLLRNVCARCGHNPQMMDMLMVQCKKRFFSSNRWNQGILSVQNDKKSANTRRLEEVLTQDTIFDLIMDVKSKAVLQQALTSSLNHQARQMLECLSLSPLGLPFSLLPEEFAHAEIALNELVSVSALDLNMATAQRAAIIPFVQEAVVLALTNDNRKNGVESRVTDLYAHWLHEVQDFRDDSEKSALIAEMIVRYMRQRQLIKATELLITFGWLCTAYGQVARIQRVYDEAIKEDRGKEIDAGQEVGRLLLSYHITNSSGQAISVADTDRLYQEVYDKIVEGNITLPPHTAVNVLHNMVLKHLDASLFQKANQMFDESFIHQTMLDIPEIYASYLHSKSRLYARWCDYEKRKGNNDNAQRLLRSCILTLEDCITQWRRCLKNALPLQGHYYNFRLARALTDYAYRQRLSGDLIKAEGAIEESILLKKASASLPQSLAVSLSEYSQILAVQGKNLLAENLNREAIEQTKQAIEETGNTDLNPGLGMLLVERADIYMQQARLDEALPLLEQAVELIGDRKSRQSFREKAEKQIEEIRLITVTKQDYKLDKRWFVRFHDLALYDDLAWLAHAGPFSEDEQDEWNHLYSELEKEEVSDRLDALIVQSRQREFARSQEEHRAPHLWYPRIPLDEIEQRIAGFEQLRDDIHLQETNVIVRTLYLEKIAEEIATLQRCQATALQDQDTVWKCDLALYGKPTEHEVMIALQPFCAMLLRAKQHEQAGPVAQELLTQLQSWGLSPQEIAALPPFDPGQEPSVSQMQSQGKHSFSHEVVQRFFQDVFDKEYRTSEWHVDIAPARDDPYVDINSRTVFLPLGSYSLNKIRELLAEEIETHAYRAMSGQRSPLTLLGLGLAKYGPTEEGLAKHRIQQVSMQIYGKGKNNSWMGTLRTGLASGVMTPALSFLELSAFFEKAFLTNLLSTDSTSTREELLTEARDEAWIQTARAFRGIPNLDEAGCCSLKDRIYLQGYLDTIRFLETRDEECLYVGKIGTQHVDALAELHILKSYYPHQNLALSTDLLERLSHYSGH